MPENDGLATPPGSGLNTSPRGDTFKPMPFDPSQSRREPIINAPLVVTATACVLVGLHALMMLASDQEYNGVIVDFALWPKRFWAAAGSDFAYANPLHGPLTLVSTALLHSGWMHVLTNAAMLLAFGAATARYLGSGWGGASRWVLLLLASIIAGSLLYVVVRGAEGMPAMGASGGASGLMAATFLIGPDGRLRSPISRQFLGVSLAFAFVNLILVLIGPQMLGAPIAWEAHAGGYLGGAAMMIILAPQYLKPRLFKQ